MRDRKPLLLHHEPRLDSELILTLEEDLQGLDPQDRWTTSRLAYGIEPLEIRDDWMRVRVSVPRDSCRDPNASEDIQFTEGWIQWWTVDRGNQLYYYARGC